MTNSLIARHRLSVAPMLDRTDRDFRYMLRLITRKTLLYTEMIHTGAILRGDPERHLSFSPQEKPLVLQLGGDNPKDLFEAARVAREYGYDGLNLNVGCPSARVQKGNFGACLMQDAGLVRECVEAMSEGSKLPVSVKHRIGVVNKESEANSAAYEALANFVDIVSASCTDFTVHARVAVLEGLSPKENRQVPPIRYDLVYRLKNDFPNLYFEVNGEIRDLKTVASHLEKVDAAMIGRAAYDNPLLFTNADALLNETVERDEMSPDEILEKLIPYFEARRNDADFRGHIALSHLFGLYHGRIGAKKFRRFISSHFHGDPAETISQWLASSLPALPQAALNA